MGCHGLQLIFSYNVFYYTYESCIIMGEVRAKLDCGVIVRTHRAGWDFWKIIVGGGTRFFLKNGG